MTKNVRTLKKNFFYFLTIVSTTAFMLMLISLKVWSKPQDIMLNILDNELISENISSIKKHIVTKGDTFSSILSNVGINSSEIADISNSIKPYYNLKKLSVGQPLTMVYEQSNDGLIMLKSLKFDSDIDRHIEVSRDKDNNLITKELKKEFEKKLVHFDDNIKHSLMYTSSQAGIPHNVVKEIIDAYSFDIDFQRDIKEGDGIEILFEAYVDENNKIMKTGNVVFASLRLGDNPYTIYHHKTAKGDEGYFDEAGNSVKKALLQTPVNGARISSNYGIRKHPILGYSKMHKGIDFAAPKGTPIYAAGHGTISEAGIKGSYGNYIKISHNNNYATAYAHISRFAKGIKKGQKVKQGQVIAYVGDSGRATGPHLHYEILKNNAQVNPKKIKQLPGAKLNKTELANFRNHKNRVEKMLASIPSETKLASK